MNWLDVAKFIMDKVDCEAGEAITNLKLQKLLYYCQAWALALRNTALFEDEFKAWEHGPVIPDAWHKFNEYTYNSIDLKRELREFDSETIPEGARNLISEVYKVYGQLPAKHLEQMTHEESPWIEARKLATDVNNSPLMSKEAIAQYFKQKIESANGEQG